MAALEVIALDTATPQLRAPGTGDTYSAPRAIAITPETLTGSAATSGLSITQTWNTTGTPAALSVAVTDTASNAASLLADFKVGGASQASFAKNGNLTLNGTSSVGARIFSTAQFRTGSIQIGFDAAGGSALVVGDAAATNTYAAIGANGMVMKNTGYIAWAASGINTPEVALYRDAANTLALRNSTNAQTFNTYGTYTDASNYRRAALAMTTAGVATLKPEGAGTGASGNVLHISGLPTSNPGPGILWNNAGTPAIGT